MLSLTRTTSAVVGKGLVRGGGLSVLSTARNSAGSRSILHRQFFSAAVNTCSTPRFPSQPHNISTLPSTPRSFSTSLPNSQPIVHIHGHPDTNMTNSNVNFDLTVGHDAGTQPVAWNRRDLLSYAVAIGVGPKDSELSQLTLLCWG